jgi:hypothetical protein
VLCLSTLERAYGSADNILSLSTPSFTESRQYNALNQVTLINRPNIFAIQDNYSATQNNDRILSALDYRICASRKSQTI